MGEPFRIDGIWTALITPFLGDGKIDFPSFEKILEDQAAAGVSGVVVSGTTGESATLSVPEKCELVAFAKKKLPSKVKVMAGTGCNNTENTVLLSQKMKELGADALLVVTPPYNKPTFKGLYGHFQKVCEATDLPVCLYHVPGRTAQSISPKNLAALSQIKNIVSVKEASGDMALFGRLYGQLEMDGTDVSLLSGDDPTFLASLPIGGEGLISVISNVFPKAVVAMWESYQKGDIAGARRLHHTLLDPIDHMFIEASPGPAKYALSKKGLCQNVVRMPLAICEAESCKAIDGSLSKAAKKLESLGDFL